MIFKINNSIIIVKHPFFFGSFSLEYHEPNDFFIIHFGESFLRATFSLDKKFIVINQKKNLKNVDSPEISRFYKIKKEKIIIVKKRNSTSTYNLIDTLELIHAKREMTSELKCLKNDFISLVDDNKQDPSKDDEIFE